MSTPATPVIPPATIPKCPHCKETMKSIDGYQYTLGAFLVLTVHCHSCKILLATSIFPVAPVPDGEPAEPSSGLWKPS
jgi:hypothetical protein